MPGAKNTVKSPASKSNLPPTDQAKITGAATPKAAKKPAAATTGKMKKISINPEERYRMIAVAAYYRAEKRGFIGGDPAQDWVEAEAEVARLINQ